MTRKHSQRGSLLLLSYFPPPPPPPLFYPACKIAEEEVERLLACGPGWLESRFRRDSRGKREKVRSQRASQGARTLKLLFVGFQRDFLSVQRSSIMRFASSTISSALRALIIFHASFHPDIRPRETLKQQCVTSSLHRDLLFLSLSFFSSVLSSSSWESLEMDKEKERMRDPSSERKKYGGRV